MRRSKLLVALFLGLVTLTGSPPPAPAGKFGKKVEVIQLGEAPRGGPSGQDGITVERTTFAQRLFGRKRRRRDPEPLKVDRASVKNLLKQIKKADPALYRHSLAVAREAERLARSCCLADDEVILAYNGGLLHDLGKVADPEILALTNMPGKLSPAQRQWVDRHAGLGGEVIEDALSPGEFRDRLVDIVKQSHSRANPGEPTARDIVMVADVARALAEKRSYKDSLDPDQIAEILREEARSGKLNGRAVERVISGLGSKKRRGLFHR